MSFHLILTRDEECAACAAFARGETTFDTRGEPSKPLCVKHFNPAIEKVLGHE